jgi:hypothetical protein
MARVSLSFFNMSRRVINVLIYLFIISTKGVTEIISLVREKY